MKNSQPIKLKIKLTHALSLKEACNIEASKHVDHDVVIKDSQDFHTALPWRMFNVTKYLCLTCKKVFEIKDYRDNDSMRKDMVNK